MSTTTMQEKKPAVPQLRARRHGPGGAALGQNVSQEARRMAAAILEVLAGARSPGEAASALGVCVPRYYQLETRALQGLVAACQPLPKGRQANPAKQAQAQDKEMQRLRRELGRHQALVRAAQRTVGLAPPPAAPAKPGAKKPRRRRLARALRAAVQLQEQCSESPTAAVADGAASGPT
jgi:hypothetical protein